MIHDPWAAAVEDAERGDFLWGQIQVDVNFVVLKKGYPKRTWEEKDDPKDRSTEISFTLNPIGEMGLTKLIQRSVLSDARGEWGRIVWPSLRDACGLKELRPLDGKFVKIETVKNGRKWTDKNGIQQEGTTFKFHAIFDSEKTCIDNYLGDGNVAKTAARDDNDAMSIDMDTPVNNQEREAALAFLPALVKQTKGNVDMLKTMLDGMPMISKFFSVESPEVKQLMGGA